MNKQLQTTLTEQLDTYTPFDELEALHVQQLRQFLSESKNPYDRSNLVGHVVADAWIVDPSRSHVVLVEHHLNNRWLAPGGHCEGNPDVFLSAVREAREETGLVNLKTLLYGNIFDLNVGEIKMHKRRGEIVPPHLHFDVCFAFETPLDTPLKISDESNQLAWVPLNKISNINFPPSHYRRPKKTLAFL